MGAEARSNPFGGAETGSDQTGGGETAAASTPAATPPAAAERSSSRWISQLALWQWARGEGGGARVLPGGVQHLWQEVNTQERNQTHVRADNPIHSNTKHSIPQFKVVLGASLNLFQEQNIQIRY